MTDSGARVGAADLAREALRRFRAFLRRRRAIHERPPLRLLFAEEGSWIRQSFDREVPQLGHGDWAERVERRARQTQRLGAQPIWDRYSIDDPGTVAGRPPSRTPDEVRTSTAMGRFFAWLVTARQPAVIVEFGTAFGVSGMYWLSGLELNRAGRLLTFEPNEVWARIALENLSAIGDRFQLTVGTFEDNIDAVLTGDQRINLAFIDAIHTTAFVMPQFELVAERLAPGGLVLLDDTDFSADMRSCWETVQRDKRVAAAAEVGRVGILEFRRPAALPPK